MSGGTPSPDRGDAGGASRPGAVARLVALWRGRGITLADQVFSSLSHVLAVIPVAHSLDRAAFGRFSLGYAVLVFALGVSRSWFGTRLSLIARPGDVPREARAVLGSLVLLAGPLAGVVWLSGWLLTGRTSGPLLLLVALATPVVCLQDAARFAAVAGGRPLAALVSDAVWTACLVAVLPFAGRLAGSTVLLLWLGAAVAALVIAVGMLRLAPDLRAGWAGLRTRHRTSESITFGTVVAQGASLVVVSVVAAVVSPAGVGSMRGASTLLGPLNVIIAYVNLAFTPALARRVRARDLRFCQLVAVGMAVVVLGWGAVVLLLPTSWGEALLADTWAGTRSVLPYAVLEYVGIGVATAWTLGLKVRAEAGMLVRQKAVVSATAVLAGSAAAVLTGDVRVVSAALALAAALGVLLGWHHLHRSVSRTPTGTAGEAAAVGEPAR